MKNTLFVLCLSLSSFVIAQNLVPNNSFEEYSKLPSSTSQFNSLKNWMNSGKSSSAGTADFYHYEAGDAAKLPTPSWTKGLIINAHSGKGIGGIIASSNSLIREFMVIELSSKLSIGKKYKVSMFYSNGEKKEVGAYATKLAFGFSTKQPDQQKWEVLPVDQIVESSEILYSNEWKQLTIEFTATAEHKFLSIGNFQSNNDFYEKRASDPQFGDWSYYFIDDIELIETTSEIVQPIIEPKKEPTIVLTNKEEELLEKASMVQFKTGKADLLPESYKILDEVVELLKKYPEGFLSIEGHTDSDGSNEDNLILSQQRAGAIMSYFIQKGIKADKMRAVGYGENKPKTDDTSNAGKAKNRRVEMKFSSRKLKQVF